MAFAIKVVLVFALLSVGVIFVANGYGAELPFVKIKFLEAHKLPAGFGFIGAGVILAIFWKIKTETIVTKTFDARGILRNISEKTVVWKLRD